MRAYKLKNCKRVHGLHFAPDGARLLVVGGEEAVGVDYAVWLDLTTGESAGRIDVMANCYAVEPALTRYAVGGADGWLQDDRPDAVAAVQWTPLALALAGEVAWETFTWRKRSLPPRYDAVTALA